MKIPNVINPCLGWRIPLLSMALALLAMYILWPFLHAPVAYQEFVTGPHSWAGIPKMRDARVFSGFLFMTLVLCIALYGLCGRILRRWPSWRESLASAFDMVFASASIWGGVMITQPEDAGFPYLWVMAALVLLIMLIAMALRRDALGDVRNPSALLYGVAGLLLFSIFSGFGISQGLSYFLPDLTAHMPYLMRIMALGPFLLAVCTLFLIVSFVPGDRLCSSLGLALLVSQAGLPLLFFSVLPSHFTHRGVAVPLDPSWRLLGLTMTVAVGAWFSLGRKFSLSRLSAERPLAQLISIPCMMALAVFAGAETRHIPKLWTDDFHLGEQMLPWFQWMDFGKVPFLEFFPFHGFMHITSGAMNALFFDGTVGHYLDSMAILFAVSACLTYWAIWRVAGHATALWCALLALPQTFYMGRMMFLVPGFLFLGYRPLMTQPVRWLVCWVLVVGGGRPLQYCGRSQFGPGHPAFCLVAGGAWMERMSARNPRGRHGTSRHPHRDPVDSRDPGNGVWLYRVHS
ncbi:MAG: hypothetical protein H7A43_06100 [Verrucomicrobia bacterium]|nr:hypothetical protein [Verrucomicrobiota bacterium]